MKKYFFILADELHPGWYFEKTIEAFDDDDANNTISETIKRENSYSYERYQISFKLRYLTCLDDGRTLVQSPRQ